MPGLVAAGVLVTGDGMVDVGQRAPQAVAGVRQPQVQVVAGGQRLQQLDVGGGQAGVPEKRYPLGQVARCRSEAGNCGVVPDVRRVGVDAGHHGAPEVRLPLQVGIEVAGVAVEPVDEHLRPLFGVAGEQACEASGDGVAPAAAQLGLVTGVEVAQMRCERSAPRLATARVDGLKQRPGQRLG